MLFIQYESSLQFAVRIFADGINVVSAKTCKESVRLDNNQTRMIAREQTIQDYVVTPQQRWIDGFATVSSEVRQFVATTLGSR